MRDDPLKRSGLRYRPELDGLRAIAVVLVILYHADLSCPGGYVGVDVFFVLSGYLIASLVIRDIEAGQFRLSEFYARRVSRIMPALFVTSLATVGLAWMVSLPASLHNLGQSLASLSVMASNFFFAADAGYFGNRAVTKPLLHTWSLSVEEQFYFGMPVLLLVVGAWRKRYAAVLLTGIGLASLAVSEAYASAASPACFLLLHSRLWELLAGVVLGVANVGWATKSRLRPPTADVICLAGLAMIAVPAICYTEVTSFPGLAAVPIVAGTAMTIALAGLQSSVVRRVLSLRLISFVGRVSYSWYLWHWPLFALLHDIEHAASAGVRLAIVAVSFLVAVFQYVVIEQPLRAYLRAATVRRTLGIGALAFSVLFLVGITLSQTPSPGLVAKRLSADLLADAKWTGSEPAAKFDRATFELANVPLADDAHGSRKQGGTILLWGDSHAMALRGLLSEFGRESDRTVFLVAFSGLSPIADAATAVSRDWYRHYHDAVLDFASRSGVSDVVLAASWSGYFGDAAYPDSDEPRVRVFDAAVNRPRQTGSSDLLAEGLRQLADDLIEREIRLTVLLEVPHTEHPNVALFYARHVAYPWLYDPPESTRLRADYLLRQGHVRDAIVRGTRGRFRVVDPAPFAFDADDRIIHHGGGRPYYRDTSHVTRAGAQHFFGVPLRQALGQE